MLDSKAGDLVSRMEHWGFELIDPLHDQSPGYGGLAVAIRKSPTRSHYDPEQVHLVLVDANGSLSSATLEFEPQFQAETRFCAGQIVVRDRVNKRIGFFSYGGTVEVVTVAGEDETIYYLHSPAPILPLSSGLAPELSESLAAETEALFAKARVQWGENDEGFLRRLAQVDVLTLYASTLESILSVYSHSPAMRHSSLGLYETVQYEVNWLQIKGMWSPAVVAVGDLLAPH